MNYLRTLMAGLAIVAAAFATAPDVTAQATPGAAVGTVHASPAAKPKALKIHDLYLDGDAVMMVEERGKAAISLNADLTALCEAMKTDAGATVKIARVPDYTEVKITGNKVHAGGKVVEWAGCPLDTTGLPAGWDDFFKKQWPRLAAAHGSGHYTRAHALAVIAELKKDGDPCLDRLIVEQQLVRSHGLDFKYFRKAGLEPGVNRVDGCVVTVGSQKLIVWTKPDGTPDVHHVHAGTNHADATPSGGRQTNGRGATGAQVTATPPAPAGGSLRTATAGGGLKTN